MSTRFAVLAATTIALLVPAVAATQPATFPYDCSAYLDTDNNPATGGDVQVIQAGDPGPQTISGIDVIVRAIADLPIDPTQWGTVDGAVTSLEVWRWNGGLGDFEEFSSSVVDYPTGNATGVGGHHVIEFTALLDDIGTFAGPVAMVYHISSAAINDYTSTFVYQPQIAEGIPTVTTLGAVVFGVVMGAAGLLLLRKFRALGASLATMGLVLAFASLAWALTITPDGNVGDWAGESPIVTDPIGDSSGSDANEDIVYGFVTNDDIDMGFRIDILNVAVSDPYLTPTPPP
jgi:hypothetical protein